MPRIRGVAQSGSAPALGAGCRRFESCLPDQSKTVVTYPFSQAKPRQAVFHGVHTGSQSGQVTIIGLIGG